MSQLAPVLEEPINEEEEETRRSTSKKNHSWSKWLKIKHILHLSLPSPPKKSNLKILLGVLACPLSPVSAPSSLPLHVSSKAQYIIQQFKAITCRKVKDDLVRNLYVSGNVTMSMTTMPVVAEEGAFGTRRGSFVLWKMEPGMWMVEMVVDGCQIMAGSDGKVAWRHMPWLGAHAAPGGARPLRRALQGLDPITIMSVFSPAQFMGEKWMEGESCFPLMLEVEKPTLLSWSDSTAEVIKHVMVGYFSQRSGLLVHLEDFQLTRIQTPGSQPVFWETSMASQIRDYRAVDGGMWIAHAGRSIVNMVRFGRGIRDNHETMRMEEEWSIHDAAFDVRGLSGHSFAPPEEIREGRTGALR